MTEKLVRSFFRPGPFLSIIGIIPNPDQMEGGVTTTVCNLSRPAAL